MAKGIRATLVAAGVSFLTLCTSVGVWELALRVGLVPYAHGIHSLPQSMSPTTGPKILVVGDSFFARRLDVETLHDRLYERIESSGVEILNSAYPGFGPLQYLRSILRHGAEFQPDIILVSHYIGNDLPQVGCKGDVEEEIRGAMDRPPRTLLEQSYLFNHLNEFWRARGILNRVVDVERLREAGVPERDIERASRFELNPYVVSLGATYPHFYRDALLLDSVCAAKALQRQVRILESIVAIAESLGASLVPVLFPHSLQVSAQHVELYRSWGIEVPPEMRTSTLHQDLLTTFYSVRGIASLDLLPRFRQSEVQLYWDEDEHLNQAGQELAAEEVSAFLFARGLVKPAQ